MSVGGGDEHDRLVDVHRAVEVTRRHAHAGRVVRELGRDDVREIICGRYRIVYTVRRNTICVLTVFEGHMQLPRDLDPDDDE
jgi:plasmid stabilization system protein ParE